MLSYHHWISNENGSVAGLAISIGSGPGFDQFVRKDCILRIWWASQNSGVVTYMTHKESRGVISRAVCCSCRAVDPSLLPAYCPQHPLIRNRYAAFALRKKTKSRSSPFTKPDYHWRLLLVTLPKRRHRPAAAVAVKTVTFCSQDTLSRYLM